MLIYYIIQCCVHMETNYSEGVYHVHMYQWLFCLNYLFLALLSIIGLALFLLL
ncbi:hypothetical protein MtrunA17_Chr3g0109161 [Medicago truncatula]|uniref:Transmembrane protein n=1 Tax=Medicago truncatula TaxID=3880 RepID=A0A396ITP5_MEDTR|nr:hypothetical protein MtrunA17_Chr3g0109161 [Medicago truncatula]